jgi:hypothetical protein
MALFLRRVFGVFVLVAVLITIMYGNLLGPSMLSKPPMCPYPGGCF